MRTFIILFFSCPMAAMTFTDLVDDQRITFYKALPAKDASSYIVSQRIVPCIVRGDFDIDDHLSSKIQTTRASFVPPEMRVITGFYEVCAGVCIAAARIKQRESFILSLPDQRTMKEVVRINDHLSESVAIGMSEDRSVLVSAQQNYNEDTKKSRIRLTWFTLDADALQAVLKKNEIDAIATCMEKIKYQEIELADQSLMSVMLSEDSAYARITGQCLEDKCPYINSIVHREKGLIK